MEIRDFEKKLDEVGLNKKEFSRLVGMGYNCVVNWNSKGRTPKWVDSWLDNYKKAKALDNIINTMASFLSN